MVKWNFTLGFAIASVFAISSATAAEPNRPIDLSHWKLTLPTDASNQYGGHAAEVSAAKLTAGFQDPHFQTDAKGHLVFWCPVNGATTGGTKYPRSELREMLDVDSSRVNWPMPGTHVLDARCRVTQVPSNPKVIIGQIHSYTGMSKPLIKLQYVKGRIEALIKESPTKDKDQKQIFAGGDLNTDIAYQIKLQDGVLSITVNGETQSQNVLENDADWANQTFYFKAGAYPQDNEGDESEGARVAFSSLKVSHVQVIARDGSSQGR
ncbi:Alginate lyase precursor [Novipirellula aureliae]|uniref:Alginate lyase n=1 Tax=Novipirellula aureliae TaxID=2527966 RepID=A0A5C6E7I1_9BACT|nr:polysaccharide lyase family 7 protein [Novipirellula aureliae]TWU45603.1 Alginate lyase precursor [Novipirellula aureliae]